MRVMGIDPSTKTGVVVLDNDRNELLTASLCTNESTGIERASSISRQVIRIVKNFLPSVVIIEGYAYANSGSLVILAEIGTLIRWRIWMEGVPYLEVAPSTMKKFITGKGNTMKDQVRLSVYKRWQFEHESNDVVDAYAIAQTARVMLRWDEMIKKDQEALKTLRKQWDIHKLTDIVK